MILSPASKYHPSEKMARRTDEYNLATMYPDLAKQWHPSRNVELGPSDVIPGSGMKVEEKSHV